MDASASFNNDAEFSNLCSFYVKIENAFPLSDKQKNSVIKYTRLPEFDFNTIEKWPKNSYALEPRLRRIIAIEEPLINTTRSLKSQVASISKMATTGYSKRKIVTIDEDEENTFHPKFSREVKSYINKAIDSKDQKQSSHQTSSKLANSTKCSPEAKQSTKTTAISNIKRNVGVYNNRDKQTKENDLILKGKETSRYAKSVNPSFKAISSRKLPSAESSKEIQIIRNKLKEDCKSSPLKKISSKEKLHKTPPELGKLKNNLLRELSEKKNKVNVIHVPLEKNYDNNYDLASQISNIETEIKSNMVDRSTDVDDFKVFHDMNVETESLEKMDKVTTTKTNITERNCSATDNKDINTFDNLKIPNVTLIKDKCEKSKENLVSFCSQSLPNLRVPSFSVTPLDKENTVNEKSFTKSTSYIISRATLTYTTKQKIDFHMVENNIDMNITPNSMSYPMSVMSVFKKELREQNSHEDINKNKESSENSNKKNLETLQAQKDFTDLKQNDSNKLMKPSEIISSIHSTLSPNDYINEQFQRELNFIDSFFESLQYLENCSYSDNRLNQSKVENFVNNSCDCKKLEYDSFFSKLENSHVDDSETIASKSLCLLNLLIRDEQRRAKNLLFVLKMREDALKDFTKSQILWLENRKKQDNIDISTLKKKQRGALLKLQHECGEMQRMRKTLLTLSEKRKVGLMKTKRNIELKFRNHVDVEQIIMEKRKLKRNTSTDRNIAPLKCFDLSSSGCEESTTSRLKSVTPLYIHKSIIENTQSAEKSIQTGDSILSTTTAEENFVVVDGSFLNILFQQLNLPEIFSGSKQYEVNEEALKNIVTTTNNKVNGKEEDAIKSFMDHVKSHESELSNSPSTARSLVEEFDQYYKGLNVEEPHSVHVHEVKDVGIKIVEDWDDITKCNSESKKHSIDVDRESVEPFMVSVETQCVIGRDDSTSNRSVAGPLPVPAGEAATAETSTQIVSTWLEPKTSSSSTTPDECSSADFSDVYPSPVPIVTPAQYEAEELRRQQLAIEKEIKALEQQQCQLLVVREIPDKPPPPYTPPTATRTHNPRKFVLEASNKEKMQKYIEDGSDLFDTDPFDIFLKDYCQENLEREKKEQGNKFWDTCHDLPKKRLDAVKSANRMTSDLKEVLTSVTPAVVSGVGARRSDHIDDILFAEWRRCEPEWTSLHTDEVIVKNQIFESIFQKILTETVDEYKKSVIIKRGILDKSKSMNY